MECLRIDETIEWVVPGKLWYIQHGKSIRAGEWQLKQSGFR